LKSRSERARRSGRVRIIGGRWRGRMLPVAEVAGLRPTADRARETLFNWLQPVLAGARVLDLFAGTGVLGLEALSRGAAAAVLVERERVAADALRAAISMLGADHATVVQTEALAWLRAGPPPGGAFDIVFVDPPWSLQAQAEVLAVLGEGRGHWLGSHARVCVERPARAATPLDPGAWTLLRRTTVGEACLELLAPAGND
jgi:16S rRNA (guanine966-N2)-methyltransferase